MLSIFGNKSKSVSAPSAPAPDLTSSSAVERQAALARTLAEAADVRRAALEESDRLRRVAHDDFAISERAALATVETKRQQLAADLGRAWYKAAAPLVEAFRASGTRDHAEGLRALLITHLAVVQEQLGATGRVHPIGFAFARAQGRLCTDSILRADTAASVGAHVYQLVKVISSSGAWFDALAKLDRCVEAAPVDGDAVTFNEAAACMVDIDANHTRELYLRRVRGLAA